MPQSSRFGYIGLIRPDGVIGWKATPLCSLIGEFVRVAESRGLVRSCGNCVVDIVLNEDDGRYA